MKEMLKYLIEDKLSNLPHREYNTSLTKLIVLCDVSRSTFDGWRKIKVGSSSDIKFEKLSIIADFFGCEVTEMLNSVPSKKKNKDSLATLKIKKVKA